MLRLEVIDPVAKLREHILGRLFRDNMKTTAQQGAGDCRIADVLHDCLKECFMIGAASGLPCILDASAESVMRSFERYEQLSAD
jgi:hypothetical protein